MKQLIDSFAEQLIDSISLGSAMKAFHSNRDINNVIITGMGGSGIGGTIVSQLTAGQTEIPVSSNSDYDLPKYAGKNTLLIISSYSGNTEETVSALEIGIERGCAIVCISSGGKVQELAENNNIPFVAIPGGNPPRSMFAYSAIQQLYVLKNCGVINDSFEIQLKSAVELLQKEKSSIIDESLKMAKALHKRIPVIYSDSWLGGVTVRWCQQINENSKMLCWNNQFPELNHNELVGWEGADNRIGVIEIRSAFDHQRSKLRMNICQPIFEKKCDTIFVLNAKGDNQLEVMLYTVLFGDWFSWHLSDLNGTDAVEIKNIIFLKNALLN